MNESAYLPFHEPIHGEAKEEKWYSLIFRNIFSFQMILSIEIAACIWSLIIQDRSLDSDIIQHFHSRVRLQIRAEIYIVHYCGQ